MWYLSGSFAPQRSAAADRPTNRLLFEFTQNKGLQQLSGYNAPDLGGQNKRVEMKISLLQFFLSLFFKHLFWDIEVSSFWSHCIIAHEDVWKIKGNEIKLTEV